MEQGSTLTYIVHWHRHVAFIMHTVLTFTFRLLSAMSRRVQSSPGPSNSNQQQIQPTNPMNGLGSNTTAVPTTDIQKVFRSEEAQRILTSEIEELTRSSLRLDETLSKIQRQLDVRKKDLIADVKKDLDFDENLDDIRFLYSELLWGSREIAGHIANISLDFSETFIRYLLTPTVTIQAKQEEVVGYGKLLVRQKENSVHVLDGLEQFRTAFKDFKEKLIHELSTLDPKADAVIQDLGKTSGQIVSMEDQIFRIEQEITKIAVDANVIPSCMVNSLLGTVVPWYWIGALRNLLDNPTNTQRHAIFVERDSQSTVPLCLSISQSSLSSELIDKCAQMKKTFQRDRSEKDRIGIIQELTCLLESAEYDLRSVCRTIGDFPKLWDVLHSDVEGTMKRVEVASRGSAEDRRVSLPFSELPCVASFRHFRFIRHLKRIPPGSLRCITY
ncbi:hypothetical protein C8Q75DRAFT_745106 [Abortiporus biennis]|nr:hypothetical protein C8Q75DRAFT_745106 [Abortiporus biennis]